MNLKQRMKNAKLKPTKLSKAAAILLLIGAMMTVAGATLSVIFFVLFITWPLLLITTPIFLLGLVLMALAVGFVVADAINQGIHEYNRKHKN